MQHGRVGGAGAPGSGLLGGSVDGGGFQRPVDLAAAAAEQVVVEALPELAGQEVEGERVDAGVEELEAEGDDLEVEHHEVVGFCREDEPHRVGVPRGLADQEEQHEAQDYTGHLGVEGEGWKGGRLY